MFPQSATSVYYDCSKVKELQSHIGKLFSQAREDDKLVEFKDTPEMQQLNQRYEQSKKQRKLLTNCKFMLGRETPVYILQNLILSFGGDFVLQDDDDSGKGITHMCMDRPVSQIEKGKEYVSPQYIVDCINNLFLLPTRPYMPGQVRLPFFFNFSQPSPAHLSPFVDNEAEQYIPDRQREINTLAGVATAHIEAVDSSDESEKEDNKKVDSDPEVKGDADSSSDGEDSEQSEEEVVKKPDLSAAQKAKKEAKLKADLKKEQEDMGKMLMSQRQRKLYQKAEETRKSKVAAAQKLTQKKKQITKQK